MFVLLCAHLLFLEMLLHVAIETCGLSCGVGECATMDGMDKCGCPTGYYFNGTLCAGELTVNFTIIIINY